MSDAIDQQVQEAAELASKDLETYLRRKGFPVVDPCGGGCAHEPKRTATATLAADDFNHAFDMTSDLRVVTLAGFERFILTLQIDVDRSALARRKVTHRVVVEVFGASGELARLAA